jgi:hypothetical protein
MDNGSNGNVNKANNLKGRTTDKNCLATYLASYEWGNGRVSRRQELYFYLSTPFARVITERVSLLHI